MTTSTSPRPTTLHTTDHGTPAAEPPLVGRARGATLTHRSGFWATAVTFMVLTAFNTVPTPLYVLYQRRDGFPTFVVTVVFAAYSIGVMLALYLAGHVSDWLGRRRVVLVSAAIEAVAAVLFLTWSDPVGLVVARFVAGLGIGLLTATATAHLAELRAVSHPGSGVGFAATIAVVANMGGLALGPLIGGVFAEWVPRPLVVPYATFLAAILVTGVVYAFVPETVRRRPVRTAYRPQRVSVPRQSRGTYWAAGAGAFAAFAVTGLFGSVAPTFLAEMLHRTDRLVAGVVAFSVFAAAAVAQVVFARLAMRAQLVVGVVAMVVGLLALGAGDLATSTAWFVAGGVVSGIGVGLVVRGALATAGSLATDGHRGEVTAGIFFLAFAGMTIPPLLVGAALLVLPIVPVFLGFVALVLALILWAGPLMIRETASL